MFSRTMKIYQIKSSWIWHNLAIAGIPVQSWNFEQAEFRLQCFSSPWIDRDTSWCSGWLSGWNGVEIYSTYMLKFGHKSVKCWTELIYIPSSILTVTVKPQSFCGYFQHRFKSLGEAGSLRLLVSRPNMIGIAYRS